MSLKHGILGLLAYRPMSGYDLAKAFRESLNFFWSAQTSQIYRELETMTASGWIELKEMRQRGHTAAAVYALAEPGREELDRWLLEPLAGEARERSSFFMRFFFQARAGTEALRVSLSAYRDRAEARAAELETTRSAAVPAMAERYGADELEAFCWSETAEFGIELYRMQASWAEACLARLAAADKSPGKPSPGPGKARRTK